MKTMRFTVPVLLTILLTPLISACGGGGDAAPVTPPPPPATYTIGGTITGLAGSVTLQNNAGDSLAVTANGAFTFASRVTAGNAYAVTISSQPLGPDCVVTSGSGTANANVANVVVTCTTAVETRYLPVLVSDTAVSSPTPADGLYVVSSKLIDRPWVRIAPDAVRTIGMVPELTLGAARNIQSALPARLTYASGTNVLVQIFRLDLTGGSDLVPRRISTLSWNPQTGGGPCYQRTLLTDLGSVDSDVYILRMAEAGQLSCGGAQDQMLLVRGTGTATSAPTTLPMINGNIEVLYGPDGRLAALLTLGPNGGLYLYRDLTFTQPTLLQADVVAFSLASRASEPRWTELAGRTTSQLITLETSDPDNQFQMRRIDYTGALSGVLHNPVQAQPDDSYFYAEDFVYFREVTASTTPQTHTYFRVPREGSGPAIPILVFQETMGRSPYQVAATTPDSIILLSHGDQPDPVSGYRPTHLYTLENGVGAQPRPFATLDTSGSVYASGNLVFAVGSPAPGTGIVPPTPHSSGIFTGTGSVVQAVAPRTGVITASARPAGLSVQVRTITEPSGFGGGVPHLVTEGTAGSANLVQLRDSSGAPFAMPPGTIEASFRGATSRVGTGAFYTNTEDRAVLYDADRALIHLAPLTRGIYEWLDAAFNQCGPPGVILWTYC